MIIWKKRLNDYGMSDSVIILLFALSMVSVTAEIISMGMFLPLFELINQHGSEGLASSDSDVVRYISNAMKFIGLKLTIEVLLISSFVLFLISKVLLYVVTYVRSYYLGLIIKGMKDRLLSGYLRAKTSYYDTVGIGDFTNSSSVELPVAVGGAMLPIKLIVAAMSATGSIILLLLISPYLTVVSIGIVGISVLIPSRWIKAAVHAGKKNSRYSSVVTSFLLDRLQSPRLVRLSNTVDAEEKGYFNLTEKHRKLTFVIQLLKARINLVLEPMVVGISLLMFYIASTVLEMSVSSVLLYMVVMIRIVPIISSLLTLKQSLNRVIGPIQSVDRLIKSMNTDTSNHRKKNPDKNLITKISSVRALNLENISFCYEGSLHDSLSNISHTFHKSTLTAIVGPSGSGKSTFVDIVSGFRESISGNVYVNGVNINQYSPESLMSLVSYIPQTVQIFDGITIFDHISYGIVNPTKSEVIDASKLSGAYDFIKDLPLRFDTILVGKSSGLSGGQKQRLDLSRALLRKAPILIMDEPTGNLDLISEKKLILNINKIRKMTDKIIIIIAHRIHTVIDADQIIVLDNGKMSGVGTHSDLLLNNPWYQKAVKELK
jgi:ABC-type multidrug transport system fused ATPase/permease subunit